MIMRLNANYFAIPSFKNIYVEFDVDVYTSHRQMWRFFNKRQENVCAQLDAAILHFPRRRITLQTDICI